MDGRGARWSVDDYLALLAARGAAVGELERRASAISFLIFARRSTPRFRVI
jgi:hypothetical protein